MTIYLKTSYFKVNKNCIEYVNYFLSYVVLKNVSSSNLWTWMPFHLHRSLILFSNVCSFQCTSLSPCWLNFFPGVYLFLCILFLGIIFNKWNYFLITFSECSVLVHGNTINTYLSSNLQFHWICLLPLIFWREFIGIFIDGIILTGE